MLRWEMRLIDGEFSLSGISDYVLAGLRAGLSSSEDLQAILLSSFGIALFAVTMPILMIG